jgi:serine/threonine-protein kinase
MSGPTAPPAGSGLTLSLSQSAVVPAAPPVRWGRWVLAGVACLLAAVIGVLASIRAHRPPESAVGPPPVAATPGLPDVRPPEKLTTTRERELLAALATEEPRSDEAIPASIELGLLYVRERRLDEAEARFKKLEGKVFPREAVATVAAHLAGRFGRGVVMAYRDDEAQHPQAAKESVKLFVEALTAPLPKLAGPKIGDRAQVVQMVLVRYPELAQAVAEALNRDAANLEQRRLTPPALEALRSPRGLMGKKE